MPQASVDVSARGRAVWSSQAFPPDIFDYLQDQFLSAVWHTEAQRRVARWLRSFGRSVDEGIGLLVDGKKIEVQRQSFLEPVNRLAPLDRTADAYILTNCSVTECLVLPARTRPLWSRRLGWFEFPQEAAKRRRIEIKLRPLLPMETT